MRVIVLGGGGEPPNNPEMGRRNQEEEENLFEVQVAGRRGAVQPEWQCGRGDSQKF